MYNGMNSFVLLAVPLFLLAGNIMNNARITDRLITLAKLLVGHIKGAMAHVNVIVSMLFAGISGSSTADAAGIGTILIPSMIKQEYPKNFTVAVTAASSVMGIIIPPSINMIVWGALTNTSITAMFLGGFIPGFLIAALQILVNLFFVRHYNVPTYPRATWGELVRSGKDGMLAAGIPIIIIGGLVLGIVSPTEAAVIAVIYALILGFGVYRDMTMHSVIDASKKTVRLASLSLFSLVGASIYGYLISFYKVPDILFSNITTTNPTTLLFIIVAIMLLIGTFMDALPAMAILIPIFMPLVREAGIHPVHFGVLAVMTLGFGLITPPYGLCLLIACKIADISVAKSLGPVFVYLGVMIILILLIAIFPDIVMFVPRTIAPQFLGGV
jgi:tripartite ATP-independent transporter DctM subunit